MRKNKKNKPQTTQIHSDCNYQLGASPANPALSQLFFLHCQPCVLVAETLFSGVLCRWWYMNHLTSQHPDDFIRNFTWSLFSRIRKSVPPLV